MVDRGQELQAAIACPVQTNEVGRCAALVGGFLTVAARTGLPLRLCEVGTSAGLNLRFDHYRYESDGRGWGPSPSPVRLRYCPPVSEEVPSVVVVPRPFTWVPLS